MQIAAIKAVASIRSILVSALLGVCITGCIGAALLSQERNRENMMRLSIGMPKSTVVSIMGSVNDADIGTQSNPYMRETVPARDGQVYDVFYYWTEAGLTPVAFANERLAGIGWPFIDRYDLRVSITRESARR